MIKRFFLSEFISKHDFPDLTYNHKIILVKISELLEKSAISKRSVTVAISLMDFLLKTNLDANQKRKFSHS